MPLSFGLYCLAKSAKSIYFPLFSFLEKEWVTPHQFEPSAHVLCRPRGSLGPSRFSTWGLGLQLGCWMNPYFIYSYIFIQVVLLDWGCSSFVSAEFSDTGLFCRFCCKRQRVYNWELFYSSVLSRPHFTDTQNQDMIVPISLLETLSFFCWWISPQNFCICLYFKNPLWILNIQKVFVRYVWSIRISLYFVNYRGVIEVQNTTS